MTSQTPASVQGFFLLFKAIFWYIDAMELKFTLNSPKLPQDAIILEFSEGNEVKFKEKAGKETLVFGFGKKSEKSQRKFFTLCRKIVRTAKHHKIKKLVVDFKELAELSDATPEKTARIIAEQFEIANFDFNKFKTEKGHSLEEVLLINTPTETKKFFEEGLMVGKEVNLCRELANTPGGDITPEILAKKAQEACKGTDVKVSIFDEKKIKELKMGAVLGVAKGSKEKTRFIIMEYWGASSSKPAKISKNEISAGKPIVLVGKGVTFDTGGLSLKPANSMLGMHMDMSGGAVVIHTMATIGKLKLKRNVIGLVPAVENMVSGESYRPGDILTSMSGKTIEVLNTDAEGRLILADALTYAERYDPKLVVDVATLTGAAVVALGERCSAIFTKDKKLENLMRDFGEEVGEYVWPLPLWEEYEDGIKGNFADLANVDKDGSRWGGAIEAAVFLYQFAKKYPWIHIDMAPRMTSIKSDFLSSGSTGEPLKLLLKLVEEYK